MNSTDKPIKVILDTDMLTDCDDAGALAVLHTLANLGEAEILGVVLNGYDTNQKHSAVVSAINYYFGRRDVPIGITKRSSTETPAKPSTYSNEIFAEYEHDGLTDPERPNAVEVYRELLKGQQDHSVTIISIGFLSNLSDLLRTEQGKKLVESKVKEISIMGGVYPSGTEYNFSFSGTAADAKHFMANCPDTVPMVFTGFELGEKVITGKGYKDAPKSPMQRAYELAYDSINVGRPSWDQIALLYGVRGHGFGDQTFFSLVRGYNHVNNDGSNEWRRDEGSCHAYLEAAMPVEKLAQIIEKLMMGNPL